MLVCHEASYVKNLFKQPIEYTLQVLFRPVFIRDRNWANATHTRDLELNVRLGLVLQVVHLYVFIPFYSTRTLVGVII